MTEIEKIKNKVELILNDDSGGSWNKNHDSDYYAKINLAKLELLEEDIPSLITTIESQKETIDEQYHTISTSNIWNSKLKDEIESLKAITELAVKGLKDIYSNELTNSVASKIAGYNLSEIAKLNTAAVLTD